MVENYQTKIHDEEDHNESHPMKVLLVILEEVELETVLESFYVLVEA